MKKSKQLEDISKLLNIQEEGKVISMIDDYYNVKSGCYIKNLDILQQIQKNVSIPLRYIDYDIQIVNSIAKITLNQQYQNPLDRFLDLEYSFPLDSQTCLYKFKATFGKTEIFGIVKEKEEAKKQYEKGLKQGKEVAYGEIDENIKGRINLKIGNVGPKTSVKITIQYIQELEVSMNNFWKLTVLSNVAPRYLNNQYHKNKKLKNEDNIYKWTFKINLKSSQEITYYNCNTHKLSELSNKKDELILAMAQECIPNTDFQFYYTTKNFDMPIYVLGETDISHSAIISFIPRFITQSNQQAFKRQTEKKFFEFDSNLVKGQYLFAIDRSGSMSGDRITKANQALIHCLQLLPPDSYFNIFSFGSNTEALFEKSEKNTKKYLTESIEKIKKFEANFGGTDINLVLNKMYDTQQIKDYPKYLFLLTDGQDDAQKVGNLVRNKLKYARFNTIGIGRDANPDLIKDCAKIGKGRYIYVDDGEDIVKKLQNLFKQVLSPVITDLKFSYEQSDIYSISPNPSEMPYIIKNEAVNLFVIFKESFKGSTKLKLNYTWNKKKFEKQIHIKKTKQASYTFIDKIIHFKKLKILIKNIDKKKKLQSDIFIQQIKDIKSYIIQQSVKHQVLCDFTAFLCIGKQVNDTQKIIHKNIKKQTVVVPQVQRAYSARRTYGAYTQCIMQQNIKSRLLALKSIDMQQYLCLLKQKIQSQQQEQVSYYQCQGQEDYEEENKQNSQQIQMSRLVNMQKPNGSWRSSQLEIILRIINIKKETFNDLQSMYGQSDLILTILIIKWLTQLNLWINYEQNIKKAEKWINSKVNKLRWAQQKKLNIESYIK